jgi:outer membrane protein TolC
MFREAGIPLPPPAQIVLWSKALGGVEPLSEQLTRLIQAGLANKRTPAVYVHRVVTRRAARLKAALAEGPGRTGGVDDTRRRQAARLAGKTPRGGR